MKSTSWSLAAAKQPGHCVRIAPSKSRRSGRFFGDERGREGGEILVSPTPLVEVYTWRIRHPSPLGDWEESKVRNPEKRLNWSKKVGSETQVTGSEPSILGGDNDDIDDFIAKRELSIQQLGLSKRQFGEIADRLGLLNSKDWDGKLDAARNLAHLLTDDQFEWLLDEYRYGGRVTLQFFYVMAISRLEPKILSRRLLRLEKELKIDLNEFPHEPFYRGVHDRDEKTYLKFGYSFAAGYILDPDSDIRAAVTRRDTCIVVLRNTMDIIEVRCSSVSMAKKAVEKLARTLYGEEKEKRYAARSPERVHLDGFFKQMFVQDADLYNLHLRLESSLDPVLSGMSVTTRYVPGRERKDARESERVMQLLDEGADISIAYASPKQSEDLRCQFNFREGRVSFKYTASESNIETMVGIINGILEQIGGYPQTSIDHYRDIPE